jgi:hypothetical protein
MRVSSTIILFVKVEHVVMSYAKENTQHTEALVDSFINAGAEC